MIAKIEYVWTCKVLEIQILDNNISFHTNLN